MNIEFIGTLKKPPEHLIQKVTADSSMTVAELLVLLEYPKEHLPYIIVLHNGRRMGHTEIITKEMTVELTVTVGGG